MRRGFFNVVVPKLALISSFLQGAHPGVCPPGTISMTVATTSELQTLMTTINCTGGGVFNVTWIGRVSLVETIEIRDENILTVTGSTSGLTDFSRAAIDAGGMMGIFTVYNGSTLSLNSLVLEAGNVENGGAVDARSFSSVIVDDCVFTNNIATNGGAIHAESSEVHIRGDTVFADNSAEEIGGAVSIFDDCVVTVDGNTSFVGNSAGTDGGAIYASFGCSIHVDGKTSFVANIAQDDGGAVYARLNSSMDVQDQGYGRGGTPDFTGVLEPLARVTL